MRAVERETELHGHIETWDALCSLEAREIVKGVFRFLDQTDDFFKAALVGHGQCRIDAQAELNQANNVGKIKIFKPAVIRNVEEDGFNASGSCHDGLNAFRWNWRAIRSTFALVGQLLPVCAASSSSLGGRP